MSKINVGQQQKYNNIPVSDTTTFLDTEKKCPIINSRKDLIDIRDRAKEILDDETNYGTKNKFFSSKKFSKKFQKLLVKLANLSPNLSHKLLSTSINNSSDEAFFMGQFFYFQIYGTKKCPVIANSVEKLAISGFTQNWLTEFMGQIRALENKYGAKKHSLKNTFDNYGTKYVSPFLDTSKTESVRKTKQRLLQKLVDQKYLRLDVRSYYITCYDDLLFTLQFNIDSELKALDTQYLNLQDSLIDDSLLHGSHILQTKNILEIDLMSAQHLIDDLRNYPYQTCSKWRKQAELIGGSCIDGQYVNLGRKHKYYSYKCADCGEEYKANAKLSKKQLPKCEACNNNRYDEPVRKLVSADEMPVYSYARFHCSPQYSIVLKNLQVLGTDSFSDVFKDEAQGSLVMLRAKLTAISGALVDSQGRTFYELTFRENQCASLATGDDVPTELLEVSAEYYAPDSVSSGLPRLTGEHLYVCGVIRQRKPNKQLTAGRHYLDIVSIEIDHTLTPKIEKSHVEDWVQTVAASPKDAIKKLVSSIETKGVIGWSLLVEGIILTYSHNKIDGQIRFHLTVIGDGGVGKSAISKVMLKIMPMHTRIAHGEASSDKLYGRCATDSAGAPYFVRGVISEAQQSVIFIDEADKLHNLKSLHTPMQDAAINLEKSIMTNVTLPCDNSIVLMCNPKYSSFRVERIKEDLSQQKPPNLTDTIENRCVATLYLWKKNPKYQGALDSIGEYHVTGKAGTVTHDNKFNTEEIRSILLSARQQKPKQYTGQFTKIKKIAKDLNIDVGRDWMTLQVCATAYAQLLHFTEVTEDCYTLAMDFISRAGRTKDAVSNGEDLDAY